MNERMEPIEDLIARSSIGDDAWIDCPEHGRQPVDPFIREPTCLLCAVSGETKGET